MLIIIVTIIIYFTIPLANYIVLEPFVFLETPSPRAAGRSGEAGTISQTVGILVSSRAAQLAN